MGLITKLFGTYSERELKSIYPIVDKIEAMADEYRALTDEELRAKTPEFKARLANGETLDDILPEAFATVREASRRVLGMRHFDCQLVGGIVLHQGRIAEMKTGEGKTLVATMPAYLNALTGKGVHIVTVNDYLAVRDAGEMGRIYEYLGLRTGVITKEMSAAEKRRNYAADITYGTNNEFGFDYLRDNLQTTLDAQMQRGHNFAIIDEVDSILIDEARTPLIISGMSGKSTDIYEKCDAAVRRLSKKVIKEIDSKAETDDENFDYIVDEKHGSAVLTPRGVKKVEEFFGIENLNDPENASIAHNVNQSIHAWGVKKRDVDYVVKDGEIIIVDPFTGRLMPGRRYQDGLHQALEAKEKVNVQSEMKVTATVTIQNYFRMYRKLSGMTGTAMTEEEEFREIYGLDVVEVPTNKPMIRIDHPDRIFTDENAKFRAVIELVEECRAKDQPVLVGTVSVEKSEVLSRMLKAKGIQHNVLNAKNHEREADIIAEAGRAGAVTIATNMAGRGTDIMLGGNPEHMAKQEMMRMGLRPELIALSTGTAPTKNQDIKNARNTFRMYYEKYKAEIVPNREKVIAAGGLYIIGSERHESRRIDNQLRGRSGRQGDPGESTFFISLQDDLMRLFADPARLQKLSALAVNLTDESGDMSQNIRLFSNVIESAQKRIESRNFKIRKNVLEYDDVLNEQRKTIYEQRDEILHEADLSGQIKTMIASTIAEAVEGATASPEKSEWDIEGLRRKYLGWVCREEDLVYTPDELKHVTADDIEKLLQDNAVELYEKRETEVGEERFHRFERNTLLHNIDEMWLDHIDDMENLKQNVMLQSYAHKDPLTEYKLLGSNMFGDLITEIRDKTAREMLTERIPEVIVITPEMIRNLRMGRNAEQMKKAAPASMKSGEKIDRNAPCPCGSGKKYKKCCGAKLSGNGKD